MRTLLCLAVVTVFGASLTAFAQGPATIGAPAAADTPLVVPSGYPPLPATPPPTPVPSRTLGLEEAVQTALKNSPALLQTVYQTRAAYALADEARSAFLPSLVGTATIERGSTTRVFQTQTGTAVLSTSASTQYSTGIDARITASETVGLASWDKWRSAVASAHLTSDAEEAERLTIIETVRNAFFNALAQKQLYLVAQETLLDQDKHLLQAEIQVKVGVQPMIDVATTRAAEANARFALVKALNAFVTSKSQLNQAMGLVGPTDYDIANDSLQAVAHEDDALNDLMPLAIQNRPEVVQAQEAVRAQDLLVDAAWAGFTPTLTGSAYYDRSGGLAYNQTVGSELGLLTLSWTFFDGLNTPSLVRQQKATLHQEQAALEQEIQAVRLAVDTARLLVYSAKSERGAAQDALSAAKEQLRLADQAYRSGVTVTNAQGTTVGNIVQLEDAELAEVQAAQQMVQADLDLNTARATFVQAMGSRE